MRMAGAPALAVTALLAGGAWAAPWIEAQWRRGPPTFPPGSLFWMTDEFRTAPTVFRFVANVREGGIEHAAVRVAAPECVFLYLNGRLVGEAKAPEGRDDAQADVCLTPLLSSGSNVLVVSTSGDTCALAGGIVYRGGRFQPLETSAAWRVQKFPPLTMLTHLDCMNREFDDSDWATLREAQDGQLTFRPEEMAAFCTQAERERLERLINECEWRLRLITDKGIVLVDWEAFGWAGAGRLPAVIRTTAGDWLRRAQSCRDALARGEFGPARRLVDATEACSLYVWVADEANNLANHLIAYRLTGREAEGAPLQAAARFAKQRLPRIRAALAEGKPEAAVAELSACRQRILHATADRLINGLNQCRENPFGWFDCTGLLGNDIADWGLRVNPPKTSWQMNLDGKWRFETDPDNKGLDEGRHAFAYNIANQWRELNVPGSWESQGVQEVNPNAVAQTPYPGVNERTDGPYNGWAWYRKTVKVPDEWAGRDLELHISRVDDWDWAYFNGEEVGHTGADAEGWWRVPRTYTVRRGLVRFGEYNTIAIRIYDCGAEGVLGSVQLRCPALKATYERDTPSAEPDVEVFASPLSPAALLTVTGRTLTLSGWEERAAAGPRALVLPEKDGVRIRSIERSGAVYSDAGGLTENWGLLWSDIREGAEDRPILLVWLRHPRRIEARRGPRGTERVTITFDRPGAQVLLMRPFREAMRLVGNVVPDSALARCRFWSATLLAYPVGFTETVERDPQRSDALVITDVYNYRILKDEWNTKPHRLAPLPPLVCYALALRHPGVEPVSAALTDLEYVLEPWGPQFAVVDHDAVRYRIPAPRFRRNGGFTSFCFSPVDIGMPGNLKELETIKVTGANSYRPQHNQHGDLARKMVQMCLKAGLNHVFNIDNRLGASDEVFEHYRALAEMCKDMPAEMIAYDLINEPANMAPEVYNPRVKRLTEIIRKIDRRHLIYVETPHSYASVRQFPNLEPTGDALTVYSFHDYRFRLPPRWPNENADVRDIIRHWMPAFKFAVENRTPIHLGEFGGFEQTKNDPFHNPCTVTMMLDYLKLFDHFGWHFHYYANRGIVRVREDGSLQESLVQDAYRRHFANGRFNAFAPRQSAFR
ncbi:MAG: cellulase family glycosylhydrolase [Armatimonadota bacterium]